jgi:hypothetical protein
MVMIVKLLNLVIVVIFFILVKSIICSSSSTTIDLRTYFSGNNNNNNHNDLGFVFTGANNFNYLGYSVSNLGDVNADGIDDIILGAYGASSLNRGYSTGIAYVIFGQQSNNNNSYIINLNTFVSGGKGFIIYGARMYDCVGASVSNAGDINGDGINDMIIGAENTTVTIGKNNADDDDNYNSIRYNAGMAYVILGRRISSDIDLNHFKSGSLGYKIYGASSYSYLTGGTGISTAGDFNNDGIDDFMISSIGTTYGRDHCGITYIIFGRSNNKYNSFTSIDLLYNPTISIFGAKSYDYAGYSISGGGDINGDGITDIIIGAPLASPYGRSNAGIIYIIYGSQRYSTNSSAVDLSRFTSGRLGFKVNGAFGDSYFGGDSIGLAVSHGGDVNNDSYTDIIIAGYMTAVYVLFGRSTISSDIDLFDFISSKRNGFIIYAETTGYRLGTSVKYAGDCNHDGIDDIIISSLYASVLDRFQAGIAYIIFGHPVDWSYTDLYLSLLDSTKGIKIYGAASYDYTGGSVSTAGDYNGDGISDYLIGADGVSVNGRELNGAVYTLFGPVGSSSSSSRPSVYPTTFSPSHTHSPTIIIPTSTPTTNKPSILPTSSNPSTIKPSMIPSTSRPTIYPTTSLPSTKTPSIMPSTDEPTQYSTSTSPSSIIPTSTPTTSVPTTTPSTSNPITSRPSNPSTSKPFPVLTPSPSFKVSNTVPSIKPTNNNITHSQSDSTIWIILPILFVTIVGTLYAYYRCSNGASKIYHSISSHHHSHGDDSIVNNDFTSVVVVIDDNDNNENDGENDDESDDDGDDDGDDECSNGSDSTEDLEPLFRISRVPVVAVATASEVSTLPTAMATIDGDILYLDLSAIVRN